MSRDKALYKSTFIMVALCNRADRYILWSHYVIGQTIYIFILFMVALCNRADRYIFAL